MSSGAVPLADYPGELVVLACAKCGRRGEYAKARLVAVHGGAIGLPDLRALLAADCPLMQNKLGNETCGAVYVNLVPNGAHG
jgi:hypothetical protein